MPGVINGLPAHILLIHAVVVLVPLGAACTGLSAVWPTARRKLGFLSPLTCLIALVFVPVTTDAGKFLQAKLGTSPAIKKHADLGETLLPWAIGLVVVSAAVWWLGRMADAAASTAPHADAPSGGGTALATRMSTRVAVPTWVTIAVAVLAVGVSVAVVVQLIRIGESGAQAVWGSTLK